jgi:acyl carrier protein
LHVERPVPAAVLDGAAKSLRNFLAENFPLGEDAWQLSPEDSLLDAGVIDSTGVLELISFLESQFGIEISDEELLPENLDSIENILRFLEQKLVA